LCRDAGDCNLAGFPSPCEDFAMISPVVQESEPSALVGSFRSFGASGPVYQVVRRTDAGAVHIVVVESGEELDYPLEQAAVDPEAR
jgi:hypothetical protein